MREKKSGPGAPRLHGDGGHDPFLIAGFPEDRNTWPAQVAAFKASRDGMDQEDGGSPDTHVLMERFRENLSQLLQDRLDQALAPGAGDRGAPGDGGADDFPVFNPHPPRERK